MISVVVRSFIGPLTFRGGLFSVIPENSIPRDGASFRFAVDDPPKRDDRDSDTDSKAGDLVPSGSLFLKFLKIIISKHNAIIQE